MSDTPRTDEAESYEVEPGLVPAEFARQLERELNERGDKPWIVRWGRSMMVVETLDDVEALAEVLRHSLKADEG